MGIRSVVSITRARSWPRGGEIDRSLSRSTILVRTLSTGGGDGVLSLVVSMILSRYRSWLGDRLRSTGLVNVSTSLSLSTNGPPVSGGP